MPYVTAKDATSLFYRSWGDGPTVVFVHGWAVNSDIWQPQMFQLSQAGFRCLAYDRRSHGRSDDPGRGYDYDTLADDLAAVLESLDLRDVTLVGHSMGNGEITRYLTRHGEGRLARVVMLAPQLPYATKTPDNPDGSSDPAALEAMRALWVSGFPEWIGQAAPAAYGPEASPDRVQHTIRMMLQTTVKALIETNITGAGTDFRHELTEIDTPILILQGDADQSCPLDATGRKVVALVRDGRLKVYPGASHVLIGSHVDEIVADMSAFMEETARSRPA